MAKGFSAAGAYAMPAAYTGQTLTQPWRRYTAYRRGHTHGDHLLGPVDTHKRWAALPEPDPALTKSADVVADTILFLLTMGTRVTTGSEFIMAAMGYDKSTVPLR